MKRKSSLILTVIILAWAFLLASCSPATTPETPPEPAATEPLPAAEVPAVPPAEAAPPTEPPAPANISFAGEVQPILDGACTSCHVSGRAGGGLDLTSYDAVMAGGNSGPIVVSGDSAGSLIIKVVESGRMPKAGMKLTADQIKILSDWISQGAQNN